MGYPYDELVPAAVLLDNPGITKEKYVALLDSVESTGFDTDMWKSQGLHGFAHLFHLPLTQKAIAQEKKSFNREYNFMPRMFFTYPEPVVLHLSAHTFKEKSFPYKGKLQVGKVFKPKEVWDKYGPDSGAKVTRIISERNKSGRWRQKLRAVPFAIRSHEERFLSIDALIDSYPEFSPENMFDFSQPTGKLFAGDETHARWFKAGEGYYLDEKHFRDTCGGREFYNWTDLILTAEAIRTKYWSVLSRRGKDNLYEFLCQKPEVIPRYEQAIWDEQTSLFAKGSCLTHNQLLRLRLGVLFDSKGNID